MKADSKKNQAIEDMHVVLKIPEAQRIITDILCKSRILESSFVAQDTQSTAFYEGQRAIGIWLKQQLDKVDPEAFARLMTKKRRNTNV